MRLRKLLILGAIFALLLSATPAGANGENPYWKIESNLPVELIEGSWDVADDGRSATLEFVGLNLPTQSTTFEAGWRTPWLKGFGSEDGGFEYMFFDAAAGGSLKVMERMQVKGERWSPWFKTSMRMKGGGGGYDWGSVILIHGEPGGPVKPVRHEWRLIGTIEGGGELDGAVTFGID